MQAHRARTLEMHVDGGVISSYLGGFELVNFCCCALEAGDVQSWERRICIFQIRVKHRSPLRSS